MNLEINGLQDLAEAAQALLIFADEEKIFIFEGEMAAGKTTFIKEICHQLGVSDVVSSPTFSIVNEYESAEGQPLYHFDFYRIKNLREAYDIGYEDYFYSGNICLIEWPEKIEEILPEHYVKIRIGIQDDGKRTFSFIKI